MFNQSEDSWNDTGDYYITTPCDDSNPVMEQVVKPCVHSIICILGLLGNSLVIVTFAFYKRTKSMTDIYLLNIAVADLLFVLSLPLIVYNDLEFWPMGLVACKLLHGVYSVNLYSCMLLLACISADRYFAIVYARRSFRLRSATYGRLTCAVVWLVALLVSIPTFYFYESFDSQNFNFYGVEVPTAPPPAYICGLRFTDPNMSSKMKVAVPSFQMAIGFFLPLLVMAFCYSSVVLTLQRARNFQRHKAVRVVLVIVIVFLVCHLPYNVALLYNTIVEFKEQLCLEENVLHSVKMLTQILAYLHCCLNPVLYAFVGVKFRNHFRQIIQDLWCLGKKYITPRRFSRVTTVMSMSTRRVPEASADSHSSFTM